MYRTARFLFLLLPFAAPAAAQPAATFTGEVVDGETLEPLSFVSVAVWAAADSTLVTGALTDAVGEFRVEGIPAGRYRVVFSYVGYLSRTLAGVVAAGAPVALGTVELEPDVAELEGVEVSAERARVQIQADRTVYNVADDPVVAGGTTSEALETIPSVEVDAEGNVSNVSDALAVTIDVHRPILRRTAGELGIHPRQLGGRADVVPARGRPFAADPAGARGGVQPREELGALGSEPREQPRSEHADVGVGEPGRSVGIDQSVCQRHVAARMEGRVVDEHEVRVDAAFVDRAHARMGVRRAEKGGVQQTGQGDVVDEAALAAKEARILAPPDGGAEIFRAHQPDRVSASGERAGSNRATAPARR